MRRTRSRGYWGTLCAKRAEEAASKLELLGRSGDLTGVEIALHELEVEMEALRPLLLAAIAWQMARLLALRAAAQTIIDLRLENELNPMHAHIRQGKRKDSDAYA